jgi:hypothetical protein
MRAKQKGTEMTEEERMEEEALLAEKAREARLRRRAKRLGKLGWALRKSRARLSSDNLGGYRLVDIWSNTIIGGDISSRYGLSLDDVERILDEEEGK